MSNYYVNLLAQAEKLHRHNRQGSYKTKERYFEAYKRFLHFVGEERLWIAFIKHFSALIFIIQNRWKPSIYAV